MISVAEVVEEEDLSRIGVPQDSPSISSGTVCMSPLVVHSPVYSPRGSHHAPEAIAIHSPVVSEQHKSPVPSPSKPPSDTSSNGIQPNRNGNGFTRHGGQHQRQYKNHSPGCASDHGNSRYQNQGYYQNNTNGDGSSRPFNKNNNNNGSYGGTKSMLPVPRNPSGAVHTTPVIIAPTGPRVPYFNNGAKQPFYPAYPNSEPIGQHQGRKNTRKSFGRGRPRDNGPSTHQTRVQNTQMNGGMVEIAAAY